MAFGTDDIQSANFTNDLTLSAHIFALVDFVDKFVPDCVGNFQPGRILVLQLSPCHRFGVTTQDDVSTTTGHVRGNRDRT